MPEKREEKKNTEEEKGIIGFTLGVVGLVALVGLLLPLNIALIYIWIMLFVCFIVGLVFCRIQQKKKRTKKGRIGFMLNLIGLILATILLVASIIYVIANLPAIMEQIQASQSLPIA